MRAGEVVFRPRPMGDGAKKAGCAASDVPAPGGDGPPSCEGQGGGFCEKNCASSGWRRPLTRFGRGFPERLGAIALLGLAVGETARAQPILGSTGAYAVMAGWTVTINGGDTINGNPGAANIGGCGFGRLRVEGRVGGADDRPR